MVKNAWKNHWLDCYPSLKVRVVFLDTSKAFDRVWHEGLIYKIKSVGMSGALLKLVELFLSNGYQRVLLNEQSSTWLPIIASVLQGFILGPLFILIYINGLSKNLSSTTKLFADDTSIFSTRGQMQQLNDIFKVRLDIQREYNSLHQLKRKGMKSGLMKLIIKSVLSNRRFFVG